MEDKIDGELNLEELDKVIAGTSHEVAEADALSKESLYRKEQIEKLEKELLKQTLESDELSMDELDNIHAGMRR